MENITFINDNYTKILVDNTLFKSDTLKSRVNIEPMFRKIISYLINNKYIKNNIIDLGAWIGDNSIIWSKMTDMTIYAIDPSESNCDFINKICKINNINNCIVINKAISDNEELLQTNDGRPALEHFSRFVWLGIHLSRLAALWLRPQIRIRSAVAAGCSFCPGSYRQAGIGDIIDHLRRISLWLGSLADEVIRIPFNHPLVCCLVYDCSRGRCIWLSFLFARLHGMIFR